jgi:hypothetical protein
MPRAVSEHDRLLRDTPLRRTLEALCEPATRALLLGPETYSVTVDRTGSPHEVARELLEALRAMKFRVPVSAGGPGQLELIGPAAPYADNWALVVEARARLILPDQHAPGGERAYSLGSGLTLRLFDVGVERTRIRGIAVRSVLTPALKSILQPQQGQSAKGHTQAECSFCQSIEAVVLDWWKDQSGDPKPPSWRDIVGREPFWMSEDRLRHLRGEHRTAHPDHILASLSPRKILERHGLL